MYSEVRKAQYIMLAVSFVVGAIIGHLLIHPYAMVAYSMMDMYRHGHMSIDMGHVMLSVRSIFEPFMLPMTLAFSVLCGLIALLMAALYERKRILNEALIENERKKASIETLHRLMVTLSHYLLNANTVIGGMVRHCRKYDSKEEICSSLDSIEEQAHKIDAVITALRKVTDVRMADYTSEGRELMIDIAKDIDELLKK